ncbi:MAG: ImmA/IrrE family metallo-endopeptidase [Oscillospiraceae bacterium]|nr:ImmA/IrrE family metallo-endopeptidase [Oscillospiraceae bacterium]
MKTLEEMYMLVEDSGIEVDYRRLPKGKCFLIMDENDTPCIAIDHNEFKTQAAEKIAIAHEYGHCATGSFYSKYTPYLDRIKAERRANEHAVYVLIPLDKLLEAVASPWNSVYDLAEHFGVGVEFMQFALELYRSELDEHYEKTKDEWCRND